MQDREMLEAIVKETKELRENCVGKTISDTENYMNNILKDFYAEQRVTLKPLKEADWKGGLKIELLQGNRITEISELSGGQKAILALCFVLGLQKCRPAPVYILDEVDAALDDNKTG